jgi:predicted ATP-binding protein involved in virulence
MITSRLADYGALSQKLDHSFPVRLLDQIQEQNDNPPKDTLHEKFEQLARAQDRLVKVGLLSPQSKQNLALPPQMDPSTRIVLTLYLEDVKKKLDILVPLADKLELFKSIINELFIYKRLEIDKDKGFTFYGSKDDEIALTDLSSGEQHQVILFYELLFQTQPQALVLIDEPELSLHVIWQEIFLKQLEQVAGVAQLDMVLATHSPQVINDRWDLTVELTGPGE